MARKQRRKQNALRAPEGFELLEFGFDQETRVRICYEFEDRLEALRPKVFDSQPIPVGFYEKDGSICEFGPSALDRIATFLLRPDDPGTVHEYPVLEVDSFAYVPMARGFHNIGDVRAAEPKADAA